MSLSFDVSSSQLKTHGDWLTVRTTQSTFTFQNHYKAAYSSLSSPISACQNRCSVQCVQVSCSMAAVCSYRSSPIPITLAKCLYCWLNLTSLTYSAGTWCWMSPHYDAFWLAPHSTASCCSNCSFDFARQKRALLLAEMARYALATPAVSWPRKLFFCWS